MDENAQKPKWVHNLFTDDSGISRTLTDGLNAQIFAGDNSMLSVAEIEPHAKGELHSHPEEQWGVLLEGECIRTQEGEKVHVEEGDFWHTPAGAEHTIEAGEDGALVLDIFSPPRPEYRSPGTGLESDSTE